MKEKRWCSFANLMCKHCSDNNIVCNFEKCEGVSYLDCKWAVIPKGDFKVVITCGFCKSIDVDYEIAYYSDDNYYEVKYTCNNCGNSN